MKRLALFIALNLMVSSIFADTIHHQLKVELNSETHGIQVRDEITLPPNLRGQSLEFRLSGSVTITESSTPWTALERPNEEGEGGVLYSLSSPENGVLDLIYEGSFAVELGDLSEEYTRGFRETTGWIGENGVYLAGDSLWIPNLEGARVTFQLAVKAPQGWSVISQGDGSASREEGHASWSSADPMEEIYLVGGPLVAFTEKVGEVDYQVYLSEADESLARQYIDTGSRYLTMYETLIGPYPYSKMAAVENFWETGYGMPSFTLLGPRVIRFPFILHSSWPHEILHNWWGNGVFVDHESGNWCEGLTAYLADHLIKEQRGGGANYRRDTLSRFRDYVRESKDFPLSEFRSRHSAATEAVGYGKSLMGFHMLRRRLGDGPFTSGLKKLYESERGEAASFEDWQRAFEAASGEDLSTFFERWLHGLGAPSLEVQVSEVSGNGPYTVQGVLHQGGTEEPWDLTVPVMVETEGDRPLRTTLRLREKEKAFTIDIEDRPLRLSVDGDFDLFRRLDSKETPPSLGQIFGEEKILAVMPAWETKERKETYYQMVDAWRTENHQIETTEDTLLKELPKDRSVWIFGRSNQLLPKEGVPWTVERDHVVMAGNREPFRGRSLVLTARREDPSLALGWIVIDGFSAGPGLTRKLPHYGKYSYLSFEGMEPNNVLKGQWSTNDSPLVVDLRSLEARSEDLGAVPMEERPALAEYPSLFSPRKLTDHVEVLADPDLEGRAVGSEGLRKAADYVIEQFKAAGLSPSGDEGTFRQSFETEGPTGSVQAANLLAFLPGTEAKYQGQVVVLSAHLDHLGRGWPDVHGGDEGEIHPGADDNASGVAVLLELAREFAQSPSPRTIAFVVFSAEESGKKGSEFFVENLTDLQKESIRGVVNLDSVGRLDDRKVTVFGVGTSREWPHIFRGIGFVTGIVPEMVPGQTEGSDQQSFIDAGIPAVQIFGGVHADYHRPEDTVDKIDALGMVKVATLVKEAVAYLADREEPLNVTIDGRLKDAPPAAAEGGRKVRLGTIPDFTFGGPGVRLDGVSDDSPAKAAGLQAGDILLSLNGESLPDLRTYAGILRGLEPGQEVRLEVRRGEDTQEMVAVLAPR